MNRGVVHNAVDIDYVATFGYIIINMVDRAGSNAFSRPELVPKFAALRKYERTKLRSD